MILIKLSFSKFNETKKVIIGGAQNVDNPPSIPEKKPIITDKIFSFFCFIFFRFNPKKLINVKKIISIDELIDEPYSNVTIELNENFKINEISEILSKPGNTSVNLIINEKNKIAQYSLQNNRKFDLNHLKALKAKEYVIKITVQSIDFLECLYISMSNFAHSYKGIALPVQ